MDWTGLAGSLIRAGAPIIGGALGGPFGSVIGSTLGGVLSNALGTANTPDAINSAINTLSPDQLQEKLSAAEAEAQAKWPALAEMVKADDEAQSREIDALQATARAEAIASDPVQRWWRPFYAIELTIECILMWVIVIADLVIGSGKVAGLFVQNSGVIITYWGARFGVLGVYVGGRSYEKVAAIKSPNETLLTPSVVDKLVKMAKRR